MEKEKIGFWKGFVMSFNPVNYEKIVKQKFGRSFIYLLIFIIIISAFLSVKFSTTITQVANKFIEKVGEKIPEISITDGEVAVPITQPYIYEVENYVFIIDTTGQITSLDNYQSGVLLTKNKFMYKDQAKMKTESYDLAQVKSVRITPEVLRNGLKKGGKFLIPGLFIAITIYFLFAKIIQLFLFSLASLFTNQLKRKNLSYPELLNIGIYALTPPTLLATIMILFDLNFPLFALIYSLFYILILVVAIGKIPQQGEVA